MFSIQCNSMHEDHLEISNQPQHKEVWFTNIGLDAMTISVKYEDVPSIIAELQRILEKAK